MIPAEKSRRAYDRAWRDKNRDKVRAAARRYYHNNKAKCAAASRAWRAAHPYRVRKSRRESMARWRVNNRAACIAKSRAYYSEHRARVVEQMRRRRAAIPAAIKLARSQARSARPEQRELKRLNSAERYRRDRGKTKAQASAWKRANRERARLSSWLTRVRRMFGGRLPRTEILTALRAAREFNRTFKPGRGRQNQWCIPIAEKK